MSESRIQRHTFMHVCEAGSLPESENRVHSAGRTDRQQ